MDDMSIDSNTIIEMQAQEIARLTHRAIIAEAAVTQLRRENATLLSMVPQAVPDEPSSGDQPTG